MPDRRRRAGGIACYVQGGGLGHLTRVRAFLHTVHPGRVATIISGSPFTADPRVTGPHRIVCPPAGIRPPPGGVDRPPAGADRPPGGIGEPVGRIGWEEPVDPTRPGGPNSVHRRPDRRSASDSVPVRPDEQDAAGLAGWLAATLRELAPEELVVDAFPAGLRGELTARVVPPGTRTVTHLARLLRWEAYRPLLAGDPVRFDRTWCVEPLTGEHGAYLAGVSASVAPLDLVEPPVAAEVDPAGLADGAWLVVHTGPARETAELLGYARDCAAMEGVAPRLVLVSPDDAPAADPAPATARGAPAAHLPAYPAWPLFARAERIISAAGCNVVRQTARYRSHQRLYPFPRRFDDQFTRAARHRPDPRREKS